MNAWSFPFRSQRMPVLAGNVVATSQPLAAHAGLAMLAAGGNAVDAAVAAAAGLVVMEPVMNGLGSDTQVLLWDGARAHGLNSSGRSPAAWSPGRFAGRERMPNEGWDSATVPGAVSAWAELQRAHGRLPLAQVLAPAIRYAEAGFAVSPNIARLWDSQVLRLRSQPGFAEVFLPGGRAPKAGERFRFPAAARTLQRIAEGGAAAFYTGEVAERIATHAAANGGAMTAADLAEHRAVWVQPVAARYRGLTVHQLPPNAQGVVVLLALGLLEHFDLGPGVHAVQRAHLQIEAMKAAFADVYAHVADPRAMRFTTAELLDPAYIATRATQLSTDHASNYDARPAPGGGTVYLAAADAQGMAVSLIQSNYQGFGSGVVVPEVGVSLNNRGSAFSLQPGHPNLVDGAKQPFHTIIPALLSRDGSFVGALGVVGANMQPQGQVQIISAIEDLRLNPQAALDMPRWRIDDVGQLRLEAECDPALAEGLRARGHPVVVKAPHDLEFGGAQCVLRNDGLDEVGWIGASDPRRDGAAVGF